MGIPLLFGKTENGWFAAVCGSTVRCAHVETLWPGQKTPTHSRLPVTVSATFVWVARPCFSEMTAPNNVDVIASA